MLSPQATLAELPPDTPSQRLSVDVVAGSGDVLNTQDDVRRDDAEHNNLSHIYNLARSRLGGLRARTHAYSGCSPQRASR
jgi:hypothetical protein